MQMGQFLTSVTDMAPSMSCLFASTTRMAPFSSSSSSMETSSCSISAHLFKSSGLSNASNKCVDLFGDAHSVPVGRVHHVYDGVRVGVVTPPVRPAKSWENISDFSETPTFYPNSPNTCLSSQVPHLELEVLVSHLLHVEANSRDRCHNLADLD